ncbi:regulatory protein, luxR family [Acetitomaculum ruminis DSM 5522]|uniref:Regulatory protein, luxR family n=1 Tax=Acetitomaculum ruminis DSM 5522 TaxID=1120918 RepID=A0A1I1AV12_9FIRM|nr:helix-turn-helix transcriptional regulator [Acetitomaculum ruminis]SFB40160.1 regulatory protein, luxR family [Acetitomaculum ruminis DSM 5522]
MRILENKDWILLNNIIYKIYSTQDQKVMRKEFIEQIKMLMDFDSADFYIADKNARETLISPVLYNLDEDLSQAYIENDKERNMIFGGRSLIYRETDIVPDEERLNTAYYKRVFRDNNWHYSLQMILSKDKKFVGVVTFYRTIGKDNFLYDDIFILDLLKEHLAFRLYNDIESRGSFTNKISVKDAASRFSLTRRETTILHKLLQGDDNNVICEELDITPNTLKKHILNVYRKLGIKNRVQVFKMIREED